MVDSLRLLVHKQTQAEKDENQTARKTERKMVVVGRPRRMAVLNAVAAVGVACGGVLENENEKRRARGHKQMAKLCRANQMTAQRPAKDCLLLCQYVRSLGFVLI